MAPTSFDLSRAPRAYAKMPHKRAQGRLRLRESGAREVDCRQEQPSTRDAYSL